LKLLAELNHRRWFSATDINTDLGGALEVSMLSIRPAARQPVPAESHG
jgi:hypothetical protein